MKKTFVLDTNVLLHDPESLFRFSDNDVVIPITVIEEIDRFKKELTEVGRNARAISRYLDKLREEGQLTEGVPTKDGGTIRIHLGMERPPNFPLIGIADSPDMRILSIAWDLTRQKDGAVHFLTKDTNLRIKADVIGVKAEDYQESGLRASIADGESSWVEVSTSAEVIDKLYRESRLPLSDLDGVPDPGPNFGVLLRDAADPKHTALARRRPEGETLSVLELPRQVSGIQPRNMEQKFALDLLLDPAVPLVCLIGKAGTGKTLLAIAAGLAQTLDKKVYRRLLVARPIFPMGRDLGYLPGDMDEKLRPWMQPIFDNLEILLGNPSGNGGGPTAGHPVDDLIDRGLLEIEALTYIRGRSLPRQFMIVDEAQNLTPHEVKTVITRAGEDAKLVLTGDPDQIDNPYVDAASNGLSYVAQRLRGEPMAATVRLTRGERSSLAEMAADRL